MKFLILFSFLVSILFSVLTGFAQPNLISNGGFESGTTGWTVMGATLSNTTDAHSGSSAAKVSNRKNMYDAINKDITSIIKSGQAYTLSAWVKIPSPAVNLRATIALNVDGVTSWHGYFWTNSPVIGSYQQYSEKFTLKWTGNLVSANLYFETESVGGIYSDYIIDDVLMVENPTIPGSEYFSYSEIPLPPDPNGIQQVIALDYNSDNLMDLAVVRIHLPATYPASYGKIKCLRNTGSMSFEPESAILGLDSLVHARDIAVADFNGDNRSDLFIADHGTDIDPFPGGQNRLYLQSPDGKLIESSSGNIPIVLDFSHSTAAADIDNDGDQDIYVCNNQMKIGPRFLINNGYGKFTVNTSNLPGNIANLEKVYMWSRFADIDRDGDQDLILGAMDGWQKLTKDAILINDGKGVFSYSYDLPDRYGGPDWGTCNILTGDFNNDGWPDLIMSTLYKYQKYYLQLLINNRDGTFSDSTKNLPQNLEVQDSWAIWMDTADFNNDGWLDIFIQVNGASPKLFLNNGNNGFLDASFLFEQAPIYNIVARDFDNDGLTDIAYGAGKLKMAKNMKPYSLGLTPINKPGKPNILYPKDGKAVSKSPLFTWQPDGINNSSHIQVARDTGFKDIVYERKQVTSINSFKVNLNQTGALYWRIRGANRSGDSDWSDVASFNSQNQLPTDIILTSAFINESNMPGTIVGYLKTIDPDEADQHTYTFIKGNGIDDADNDKFFLAGDTLKTKVSYNFGTQKYFHMNVQSDDGNGGKFVRGFSVNLSPAELKAFYPFNGNSADESGHGKDGKTIGTILTTDRFGNENRTYHFDGIDDKIVLGKGLGLINNQDKFTIIAWIYPEELNQTNSPTILGEREGGNNYQLCILNHRLYFSFWSNGAESMFTGSEILPDQWTFITVTYDGQNVKFFINGQLDKTFPAAGKIDSNPSTLNIGSWDGSNGWFKGKLDEIAFYNKALTPEEILTIYRHNPSDILLSNASIEENQPSGKFIGKFTTTDPDVLYKHAYSLIDGSGSEGNSFFIIKGDTLCSNKPFNYEAINSYSIRVRTNLRNNGVIEKIFQVSVLDVIETGIGEIEEADIKIYPQPSDGIVFVESPGWSESAFLVQVYNMQGSIVYQELHRINSSVCRVDLSACSKGMYIVKVITDKSNLVRKILIE